MEICVSKWRHHAPSPNEADGIRLIRNVVIVRVRIFEPR